MSAGRTGRIAMLEDMSVGSGAGRRDYTIKRKRPGRGPGRSIFKSFVSSPFALR
jgi:hypothetical protein